MRQRSAGKIAAPGSIVRVTAADGCTLGAQVFEPARRAAGTVVIHGGTAIPQSFYARFAAFLAEGGLRAVTYDYRGVGESRPETLRGFRASMTEWARLDAAAVLSWVRERWPGAPLGHVGHSFGGQLIGLIDDELEDVAGTVIVATQLPHVGDFPPLQAARIRLLFQAVVPALARVFGYVPGAAGLGVDLPSGVALEWARWCLHPDYLGGYHRDAAARFRRFDRAALYYTFTDDDLAPPAAIARFVRALPFAKLNHRHLAPQDVALGQIGHLGFFRPQAAWLWREARAYLADALGNS